jgi:hypothetical protein
MPAFTRRQYAGAAAATTITAGINPSDTTCSLAATTGWPSTAAVPFYVVIDPGTSAEEKCSATISGSTLTLTRAQDDTTATSHSSGATIYPVFTANDADEANEVVAKLTTKGDLLATDGSALNRLAVGTNDHVLMADSTQTNGVKWAAVTSASLSGVGAAWTSFTPVWTAVTTDPAIGNGTIQGKFCRVNKLIVAQISATFGSTTTYGSGHFLFEYPVESVAPTTAFDRILSSGHFFDASGAGSYPLQASCQSVSTTEFRVQVFSNASQVIQVLGATVPLTLASTDTFQINFCYEAA